MKHILEFFHDVIPIVFVVGIVALVFVFFNHTKNLAAAGMEKAYTFDEELENADVLVYDQMTVSGADVIAFVRTYYKDSNSKGAFSIKVSNINSGAALTTKDISAQVNNNTRYKCQVSRDGGTVQSVTFQKQ